MHWIPGMPRDSASLGVRFFGGGSSSPSGQTTTTQNSQPWSAQVPYLQQGMSGAQNLYENYSPSYFPSSTVANFTPAQVAGQNAELSLGMNGTPAVEQSGNFLTGLEQGKDLANPGTAALSPFTSGAMLSAGNPYFQNMADSIKAQVEPGITSTFNQGNEMNNPNSAFAAAQGVGSALAQPAFQNYMQQSQNMLAADQQMSNNWNAGVNQQIQGSIFAPGIQNAEAQRAAMIQDVGQQQQAQNQAQLNDQVNRWNFNQQLPYNKEATFMNMINGNYGGTSTLSQPYFSNNSSGAGIGTILGMLGGAAAGVATGGAGFAALAPYVMAGGMGGGAAGSAFSDPRTKKISGKYAGALETLEKLPVSKARYVDEDEGADRAMIMSTDLKRVMPTAVHDDPMGSMFEKIDPMQIVPLLIAGVQELRGELDAMRARRRAA